MQADAISTAVFVLGVENGMQLLTKYQVDGIILAEDSTRRVAYTTSNFVDDYDLSVMPFVELAVLN